MKIQQATRRETMHIAVGAGVLTAVLNAGFALAGHWDLTVLWGSLFGGVCVVLNFFLLGLTVQKAAATANENRAKQWVQFSYSLRLLFLAVVMVLGFTVPFFNGIAVLFTMIFPRITILTMQFTGAYKPEPKNKGGDDAV